MSSTNREAMQTLERQDNFWQQHAEPCTFWPSPIFRESWHNYDFCCRKFIVVAAPANDMVTRLERERERVCVCVCVNDFNAPEAIELCKDSLRDVLCVHLL